MTQSKSGASRTSAILITGAGGEVGHGLIQSLYQGGRRDVVAIDVRELPEAQRSLCQETFVGDICDRSLLERLLAMFEIREMTGQEYRNVYATKRAEDLATEPAHVTTAAELAEREPELAPA